MKTQFIKNRLDSGSVLMVSLLITAIAGFTLVSYLTLVSSQNTSVTRSQFWNLAMPIAEAGIEEALTHLNDNCFINDLNRAGRTAPDYTADSWLSTSDGFTKTTTLPDGSYYIVTILFSNTAAPVIYSEGHVVPPPMAMAQPGSLFGVVGSTVTSGASEIGRKIKVTVTTPGLYSKGLVAKSFINMNGNGIQTDSFDSSNPSFSAHGQYDPNKHRANGDVATVSGLTNVINVGIGNANIYGRVATGPGGQMSIGPNGSVGELGWSSGVQPGYFRQDLNASFPDVQPPFTGGAFTPASGDITITNAQQIAAYTNVTYPTNQSPVTTNYVQKTTPGYPSLGTFFGTPGTNTVATNTVSAPSGGYVGVLVTNTTSINNSSTLPSSGTYQGIITTNKGSGKYSYSRIDSYSYTKIVSYTYTSMDIMNYTYSDVVYTTNSVHYDYVLDTGNYKLTSLNGTVYVRGNAVLYVTGSLDTSGILIGPNGSLKLYSGAPSVSLAGNGVVNQPGYATNFFFYGLPTCTSVSLSGNAGFTGTIYAPQADLRLNGGGNNRTDFIGAGVFNSVSMNGHFNFHYDEALLLHGPTRGFVINSWQEVPLH